MISLAIALFVLSNKMGGTVCKLIFSKWQIYFCIIIIKGSHFLKQKKQDLWKTGIYSNIFRFLDDLCTFNIMMNLEIITRYLPWWAGTQEGKWIFLWNLMFWIFNRNYQSHALFDNNIPSKIFYVLKFHTSPGKQQTWLIW